MKEKNLIALCVILAVLIGLLFVKSNMKKNVPAPEEVADLIVPAINGDTVSGIVISFPGHAGEDGVLKGNGEVRLVKDGAQWRDETQYGVRASETTIAPALEKLDQLKGELRSNREGILEDYGITDDQALELILKRVDGEEVHLLVGTEKAGFQNNFVRMKGSNAVYLVNENLLVVFGVRGVGKEQELDTKKWIDKRITHLAADNVTGISIEEIANGTQQPILDLKLLTVDDKKKWESSIPYEFNLNANKIKQIVENFNNTHAREIIAPDVPGVFDAPAWTGTFTLADGQAVTIVRGEKDSEGQNYYVKEDGVGYYFLVPVSSFDGRVSQQGDIFANNPLKAEEGALQSLVIKDMENKKEFSAVKQAPAPAMSTAEGDGSSPQEPETTEDVWLTSSGEALDIVKVREIINQISGLNVEAIPSSVAQLAPALTISLSTKDGTGEYTISKDFKLDNGKECQMLQVRGKVQGYCVSKSQVTALRSVLP